MTPGLFFFVLKTKVEGNSRHQVQFQLAFLKFHARELVSPDRAEMREAAIHKFDVLDWSLVSWSLQNYKLCATSSSSIQKVIYLPNTMLPWHHDRGNSEEPASESTIGKFTLKNGKKIHTAQHRWLVLHSTKKGDWCITVSALNFLRKNTRTRFSSKPMLLLNSRTVITKPNEQKTWKNIMRDIFFKTGVSPFPFRRKRKYKACQTCSERKRS